MNDVRDEDIHRPSDSIARCKCRHGRRAVGPSPPRASQAPNFTSVASTGMSEQGVDDPPGGWLTSSRKGRRVVYGRRQIVAAGSPRQPRHPPCRALLRAGPRMAYNWPPSRAMSELTAHQPRVVPQVMVSSTFTDLQQHRTALIEAIHGHKLHANVMENDSATLLDVVDSSLQMVRDSAAYIAISVQSTDRHQSTPGATPTTSPLLSWSSTKPKGLDALRSSSSWATTSAGCSRVVTTAA